MASQNILLISIEELIELSIAPPPRVKICLHDQDLLLKSLHEAKIPLTLETEVVNIDIDVLHQRVVDITRHAVERRYLLKQLLVVQLWQQT